MQAKQFKELISPNKASAISTHLQKRNPQVHRNRNFNIINKFNPYHGKDGRFTSSRSAASFTYKPGASTAHSKAIEREKEKDSQEGKGFKGTLYHGSPSTDIKEFDMKRAGQNTSSGEKLLFFTDSKQMADDFSYERLEGSSKFFQERGKKGRVYEVDVEMKNPLDLRKLNDKDIDNILKLDEEGILTKDMVQRYANSNHQLLKAGLTLTSESLKNLGYDGLIANTGKAGHNSIEYAVVDSKQAKIKKSIDIKKYNKWHGKDGRFTSGPGGSGAAGSNEDNILSQVATNKCKEIEKNSVSRTTEEVCIVDSEGYVVYRNTGDAGHVDIERGLLDDWSLDAEGDCISTHNHPGEFGGTFSVGDIEAFEGLSDVVRSYRAVGKEGVYSITRIDDVNPEGHKKLTESYKNFHKAFDEKMEQARVQMNIERTNGSINTDEANSRLNAYRNELCKQNHEYLQKIATSYGFKYVYEPSDKGIENRDIFNKEQKERLNAINKDPNEYANFLRLDYALSGIKMSDMNLDDVIEFEEMMASMS